MIKEIHKPQVWRSRIYNTWRVTWFDKEGVGQTKEYGSGFSEWRKALTFANILAGMPY